MKNMGLEIALENLNAYQEKCTSASIRLLLLPNEHLRIPSGIRGLSVRSGIAWVSYDGMDYLLDRNKTIEFAKRKNFPVVSNPEKNILLLEFEY